MVIIKKSIGMPTKRSSPYSRRDRQSRESDLHQSRFPTQPQDHRSFPAVPARVLFLQVFFLFMQEFPCTICIM